MVRATQRKPTANAALESGPAGLNPAVARCCAAWQSAYQAETAREPRKENQPWANYCGHKAYRNAMPPLCGSENIRDFIACIAHGILIGSIRGADGARLLYAAQVAATADRSQPAQPKATA
jgi:hypothetical protein